MNATQRAGLLHRWSFVQAELIPGLGREFEALTPKLMKLIHTLEWARIEELVPGWHGIGRPPADRSALANGFVAKAVLGLTTTVALIERLTIDRALRRICGFSRWNKLPDEATFSRAFAEFAASRLAERVHEAVIKAHLGSELIGHISRDGTAIIARERPAKATPTVETTPVTQAVLPDTACRLPRQPHPDYRRSAVARAVTRSANPTAPASNSNAAKPWRKCKTICRAPATGVRSAMPKATRPVGTATSCTSTRRIAAYPLLRFCPAPQCTTARPRFPCRS